MGYRVINGTLIPIGNTPSPSSNTTKAFKGNGEFSKVLDKQLNTKEEFIISNHAAERLMERNISFNETDMKNINDGINQAAEKGSRDSLILYKDVALVASVRNRTIITAVERNSKENKVFTNIDSVVLL